ncbi:MAG TPA: hypothetical protein VH105_00500 [Burkholderiales bacterium]|nr:hypothetical protein [Burkholderiales bacterium]
MKVSMHISDIGITRSSLHARAWKLHIEMNGLSYDGWFDDFGGFLTAIQDAATFFAYRAGKMSLSAANETSSRMLKRNARAQH